MSSTAMLDQREDQRVQPVQSGMDEDQYELRQTIEQLQRELEDERTQSTQCKLENTRLKTENEQVNAENQRLNGILREYNQSKQRLQELERLNATLNTQISELQSSADELNQIREQMSALESSSHDYQAMAEQIRSEKAALEQQLGDYGVELSDALNEMARMSSVIDALNEEKKLLATADAAAPPEEYDDSELIKRDLQNSEQAIRILNDQFERARDEGFELAVSLAETEEALQHASAEAEEKTTLLRATSRELDNTQQAIEDLNDNVYRLRDENFELSQTLAQTLGDRQELEDELEEHDVKEAEQEQTGSDIVDLRRQMSSSEQAVEIMNDNFYALRQEHFELMQKYAEARDTIEELTTDFPDPVEEAKESEESSPAVAAVVVVEPAPEVFEEKAETIKVEADLELRTVGGLVDQMRQKFAAMEQKIAELENANTDLVRQTSLDMSNPFTGTHSVSLDNDDLQVRLAELRGEYDRLSEQSISDSMTIRTQKQDFESLSASHSRLRQEKAGLENILTETRNRLAQYDQQVRMLMDANAELDETRDYLRQKKEENKKLQGELETVGSQQEEIRDLHRQVETVQSELEQEQFQRVSFAEQAAVKDLALRQAQARLIALESDMNEDRDEAELPGVDLLKIENGDSLEMDEVGGPEISDRFSLTERASEIASQMAVATQSATTDASDDGAEPDLDEYDMGDLDDEPDPIERVDPHTIASDGKELDPEDVEPSSETHRFRVHVENSTDHKELDPTEIPVEIRSEEMVAQPRMSFTRETERRISYVEEDEPQPSRLPDVEESPVAIPSDDPADIDI